METTITIQLGDTLSGIAEQYGVTVEDILNWNSSITNPNNISVGEQIVIYTNEGGSTSNSGQNGWKEINSIQYYCVNGIKQTGWYGSNGNWYYLNAQGAMESSNSGAQTTQTVQVGDKLSGIALKYNVTIAQLQTWNQISNPNDISIGQVLNV